MASALQHYRYMWWLRNRGLYETKHIITTSRIAQENDKS
ncbi:hypothetical protein LCGC14_1582170 [marine sediment metagenome]|uniref:Uncharacterized protein n=1 Tax=marine sediment metagenome TaxID=412755 RepID=A0A0F9KX75_9ZZZZ